MFREEAPLQEAAGKVRTPVRASVSRTLSLFTDPRLISWNAMLLLMSPLLVLMKLRRYQKKHAPQEFSSRRWTVESRLLDEDRAGPHVVFVAASYGEVVLVKRLTVSLRKHMPHLRITWAIRDPASYDEVAAKQPDQSLVIQPFDSAIPVARWLRRVDPDVVVMMERYNFPDLVSSAKLWGAKVVLVNGRAKGAYQKAGGLVRSYYRWVFGSYDAMLFQSTPEMENASSVAPSSTRMETTGNIKLDVPGADIAPDKEATVRRWLSPEHSPILAAGSTDELEEDRFVLDAFVRVRKDHNCRLLLAPRSLDRPSALKEEIEKRGLTYSFRTSMDPLADVHVLDTMGELTIAYGLSTAAYVGGSLLGMGHNIAEPLESGVPVCYGPRRGHFDSIQRLCERFGVGFRIKTSDELAEVFGMLLTDSDMRYVIREKAKTMLERERGASDRTVNALLTLIQEAS